MLLLETLHVKDCRKYLDRIYAEFWPEEQHQSAIKHTIFNALWFEML